MKRDHWIYSEQNLLVEKYQKVLNTEHIEALDGRLLSQLDKSRKLLHLVDVSQATLFNIDYGDISGLFEGLKDRIGESNSVKIALFSGENDKDDFMKVSTLTKYESDEIQMRNFVELKDALNWLEIQSDIREKVWSNLNL